MTIQNPARIAVCMFTLWATALISFSQTPVGEVVLTEDGRVIGGTSLATKADINRLENRLDALEKEIVVLKTWGVVIGFIVTLATPALTVLLTRKFGAPMPSANAQLAETRE